jgi:hypothetical protein
LQLVDGEDASEALLPERTSITAATAMADGVCALLNRLQPPAADVCVILLDALDESAQSPADPDNSVISLLTATLSADAFPKWLRFVVTARPGTQFEFKGLRAAHVACLNVSDAKDNGADVVAYVTQRLTAWTASRSKSADASADGKREPAAEAVAAVLARLSAGRGSAAPAAAEFKAVTEADAVVKLLWGKDANFLFAKAVCDCAVDGKEISLASTGLFPYYFQRFASEFGVDPAAFPKHLMTFLEVRPSCISCVPCNSLLALLIAACAGVGCRPRVSKDASEKPVDFRWRPESRRYRLVSAFGSVPFAGRRLRGAAPSVGG